jgi:hypothetical protein
MSAISLSDLPGIMFWDNQGESEYFSFAGRDNPGAIRDALRTIFDCTRQDAIIQNIATARMRLECSTLKNITVNPLNIACCLTHRFIRSVLVRAGTANLKGTVELVDPTEIVPYYDDNPSLH